MRPLQVALLEHSPWDTAQGKAPESQGQEMTTTEYQLVLTEVQRLGQLMKIEIDHLHKQVKALEARLKHLEERRK